MVELVDHAPGRLPPWPGVESRPLRSTQADRWPRVAQKRTELMLAGLLAILYGGAVSFFEPAFVEHPSAALVHLLLPLGAAVLFFGLWDTLSLLALRRLLRRDQETLWWKYGHCLDFQRRLDNSTFELDSDLGAGLVNATLRRFTSVGRPDGNFVAVNLLEAIRSSRIGALLLDSAAIAAPILGLLDVAWRPGALGGASLSSSTAESAWVAFALGLGISLVALLFRRLGGASLVEDCALLLAPVIEASRGLTGRGKARWPSEGDERAAFEKRRLAWTSPPWSGELRRLRMASAIVSWSVAASLILVLCL